MTQAVRNAADRKQVEAASRVQVDTEKQYAADLAAIAHDPAGERVLRRLLGVCGVFESGYAPVDGLTYFRAGKREVGLALIADLTLHAPTALRRILIEETV